MQKADDNNAIEIDLVEVLTLLWHRAWLIILCGLAAGAVGYGVSRFLLAEKYQSTTRIYVLNRQNDNTLTYSDVQLGTQLTKDFVQIIKSRYVLEKVIASCGLEESSESLGSRVGVETQSDTRIIAITVTDRDPAMAQYLADEVRKEAGDRLKSVMDIQAVNLVDEANYPLSPSSPRVGRWTVGGVLAGVFLSAAILVALFLMDDTIKTSEDVERYLGLSTLGMIPLREDVTRERRKRKGSRRRKSRDGSSVGSRGNGNRCGEEGREEALWGGSGLLSSDRFADIEVEDMEAEDTWPDEIVAGGR